MKLTIIKQDTQVMILKCSFDWRHNSWNLPSLNKTLNWLL